MQDYFFDVSIDDEMFIEYYELPNSRRSVYCRGTKYPTRDYLLNSELDLSCIGSEFSEKFYLDFLQDEKMQKFYFKACNKHLMSSCGFVFDDDPFVLYPRELFYALTQLNELKKIDLKDPKVSAVYKKAQELCSIKRVAPNLADLQKHVLDDRYNINNPIFSKFFDPDFDFASYAQKQNNSFEFRKILYALSVFEDEFGLEYFFEMPQTIHDRIEQLNEYKFGDFANVDYVLNDKLSPMDIYDTPVVNPELKEFVFRDMPKDLNKLGQALYVYYKLCHTLQYDDQYYNEAYTLVKNTPHRDIKDTIQVTPSNNAVICTEFTAIYAVLLRDLGIIPHVHVRKMENPFSATDGQYSKYNFPYDGTHVWVEMNVDQFVVRADSTPSIIAGDLAKVKFGGLCQIEDGLKCHNTSQYTQNQFWETADKVKQLLAQQNIQKVNLMRDKDLQKCSLPELRTLSNVNARKMYERLPTNHYPISFKMRVKMLCDIVENTNLHGLELAQYLTNIRDNIFTGSEYTNRQTGKAKFSFVRDDSDYKNPQTTVLFSYDLSKNKEDKDIHYCILDGGQKPKELTQDQIEFKYRNAEYVELVDGSQPLGLPHIKCK